MAAGRLCCASRAAAISRGQDITSLRALDEPLLAWGSSGAVTVLGARAREGMPWEETSSAH